MMYRLNDNDEFLVRHCEYDDLGHVAKTMSHTSALSTNYSYNVRGQLTSAINPLTEQRIYYNTSCQNSQNTLAYNGDVSAYEWKGYKDGIWKTESYAYEYDEKNRLSSAYSMSQNGSEKTLLGLHDSHYEYDLMGNITNITRKGINCDDGEAGYKDNATLDYDGNQLVHVSNKGYKDSSSDTQISDCEYSNAAEYQYDANGNMTRNLNKGILKVTYNVLNLPEYIYMKDNQCLHYKYDGDGNRLSVEVSTCKYNITVPQSGEIQGDLDTLKVVRQQIPSRLLTANYYYSGEFEYSTLNTSRRNVISKNQLGKGGYVLDRINFDEGYIVPGQSKFQIYDYVKDYLGNIRFVVKDGHVVDINNYYPFGGFFNEDENSTCQGWRFGGKKLNRAIDQYNWKFRIYDPTVGAFTTVDPMCELSYGMTPYAFANNNPANYTDLFGLKTYSWDEFVNHWQDFDVKNDDVELPQVVCTASKPGTNGSAFESLYDSTNKRLGQINDYSEFLYNLNRCYGGSRLSQPLWNVNSFIKYHAPYLNRNFHLSTFHPSHLYKGITNGVDKLYRYGKVAGRFSSAMTVGKLIWTGGDISASDALDVGISSVALFVPGYGWMIEGGYLLLDTGVELCTGKNIGEHLNECMKDEYGYNTLNLSSLSFK